MGFENRAPVAAETTLADVPVTGQIPPGLTGTLYRNGPNPLDPDPAAHWFFGNGMVHAFELRDGRVAYRNRWVRTRWWARAAGSPDDALPDGVANTSVVAHAGALLALEEAHMPVRLDGASLATLGTQDFGGALPDGPFTAHPKTCPLTGNLVFFGYGADGHLADAIRLGEVAADGRMLWQAKIHAPFAGAMIHDFAVTAHHIAIPLFPLVLDLSQGGFVWKPRLGAYLGVIERARGVDSLRWIPLQGGFAFHVANAWEEDGRLTIELMRSDAPPLFPAKAAPGEDASTADTEGRLTRWSVDLADASPVVTQHLLSSVDGEFPRIDERWAGQRHRHVFWSSGGGLHRRDDMTGQETTYVLPTGDNTSEPVFVADGGGEGEGWILAVLYRAATQTSDLAILDARNLAAGPVALARLPVRVPDGFHGAWLDASVAGAAA